MALSDVSYWSDGWKRLPRGGWLAVLTAVVLVGAACSGSTNVESGSGQVETESTEEPTQEPTEDPTEDPTQEPTEEPTEEPTPTPTEEPTPEPAEEAAALIDDAADNSAGAEALRWEMWVRLQMNIGGIEVDSGGERPAGYGETDGTNVYSAVDMSSIFENILGSSPELVSPEDQADFDALMARADELIMETIETDDYMFMRMPMLAVIADLDPAGSASDPELATLMPIATDWGVVDFNEFPGASSGALTQGAGGQSGDPDAFLDVLEGVGEVEEVGAAEVRGVQTTHFAAVTTFAETLALQGMDEATFEQQMQAQGLDPADAGFAAEEMADTAVAIEVWIDEEGLVRRVRTVVDFSELFGAAGSMSTDIVMEFFDYDSPDIVVEVPDPATSVDLAQLFGLRFGEPTSGYPDAYAACNSDSQAATYGDNPGCDRLLDVCASGDMAACDDLWWTTQIGSELEAYGATCGLILAADDPKAVGGNCRLVG